jgi:hypothetical protein
VNEQGLRAHLPSWCALAAQVLGWRPGEFWQATPSELAAAIGDPTAPLIAQGPTRHEIDEMMERESNG